jgi:hypothetical protein
MVGHDDEGVKLIAALIAVVGKGVEEEVSGGFYLEESAAVGRDGSDEVRSELLRRRERHLGRDKGKPGAKAPSWIGLWFRGLKAPAPFGRGSTLCGFQMDDCFNDSQILTPEKFQAYKNYIEQNPVRAGLTIQPEAFPYSSTHRADVIDPPPSHLR